MKMTKKVLIVATIVIVAIVGISLFTNLTLTSGTNYGNGGNSYKAVMGKITLAQSFPDTPTVEPIYRVTPQKNDTLDIYLKPVIGKRSSVISEEDAPAAAKKILERYGGLPSDAVFGGSKISYVQQFNKTTQQSENVAPLYTDVWYRRSLNGKPVFPGGYIELMLGENGELLELRKVWRTVEPPGAVRITPATQAFQKLIQGNDLDHTKGPLDVKIDRIRLGYYEDAGNGPQESLEPVWFFQGINGLDGHNVTFLVYACQFAAFTQTPAITTKSIAGKSIQEKDPFTATFTDTSDANPTKWQWDFGDGTTSAEKSPTHKYKAAGSYNVTLTVWNDLGSDTTTQKYTVNMGPAKMPDVIDTIISSAPTVSLNASQNITSDNSTTG